MRHLSVAEVLTLHRLIMEQAGTISLLRDLGALESAVAQPRHSFGGDDLYPTLAAKAGALGFSLIKITPSWTATSALVTPLSRRSFD